MTKKVKAKRNYAKENEFQKKRYITVIVKLPRSDFGKAIDMIDNDNDTSRTKIVKDAVTNYYVEKGGKFLSDGQKQILAHNLIKKLKKATGNDFWGFIYENGKYALTSDNDRVSLFTTYDVFAADLEETITNNFS